MRSSIKPAAYAPMLTRGEDWREQALCAQPEFRPTTGDDPWYSDDPVDQRFALAICGRCPVQHECAEIAGDEKHGIWAGRIRGRKKGVTECKNCDTLMRPRGKKLADFPGTALAGPGGFCYACYRHADIELPQRATITPGQPCSDCSRPLRPRGTLAADHPGTLLHSARGRCLSCCGRDRSRGEKQP